jgi:hypothetical protein
MLNCPHTFLLTTAMTVAATTASASYNSPMKIEKLGTADFSMVETTPVVWKGKLLRFESVGDEPPFFPAAVFGRGGPLADVKPARVTIARQIWFCQQ